MKTQACSNVPEQNPLESLGSVTQVWALQSDQSLKPGSDTQYSSCPYVRGNSGSAIHHRHHVILVKRPNFSEPQFPYLCNGGNTCTAGMK